MPAKITTKEIVCCFIGSFKVGDNLAYNADILCGLVRCNEENLFNKMIVLQSAAVIETALQQIIFRAQNFNREGVPNISELERNEIESKKIEKFAVILTILNKYGILSKISQDLHKDLDELRKIRNKIHIQDFLEFPKYPSDEPKIFTVKLRDWSLNLLEKVLVGLNTHYPRPKNIQQFATKLLIPIVEKT